MDSEVVLGKITSAATHLVYLCHTGSNDFDLCANRCPIALCSRKLKGNPMIPGPSLVMKNHWPAIDVFDYDVHSSVIVQIAKRGASTGLRTRHGIAYEAAHVSKCSVTLIQEYEFALLVLCPCSQCVHL